MRLFVALQLEDRVKDALIQFIDSVRPHTQEGRFSHRENLHLISPQHRGHPVGGNC